MPLKESFQSLLERIRGVEYSYPNEFGDHYVSTTDRLDPAYKLAEILISRGYGIRIKPLRPHYDDELDERVKEQVIIADSHTWNVISRVCGTDEFHALHSAFMGSSELQSREGSTLWDEETKIRLEAFGLLMLAKEYGKLSKGYGKRGRYLMDSVYSSDFKNRSSEFQVRADQVLGNREPVSEGTMTALVVQIVDRELSKE